MGSPATLSSPLPLRVSILGGGSRTPSHLLDSIKAPPCPHKFPGLGGGPQPHRMLPIQGGSPISSSLPQTPIGSLILGGVPSPIDPPYPHRLLASFPPNRIPLPLWGAILPP